MSVPTIIFLGALAGLTIFLGLPFARLKNLSATVKGLVTALATGVLLYLLTDVTSKMLEPIAEVFTRTMSAGSARLEGLGELGLLVVGLSLGLVGIVALTHRFQKGAHPAPSGTPAKTAQAQTPASIAEIRPETLSLIIAIGIGAHNLSEGLAIGQAAASGSLQLAWLLILGFGLHNLTEGFGIAGPLSGRPVSWKFLGALGLIGGGPTFWGTVLGISFHSPELFVFSLAFAAGAILYVVMELLGAARRYSRLVVAVGLLAGFLLGLGTDFLLTLAGA
ncbi:MAG: zinc permease [Spirochaetales bacterium]|nr:zinc permease [Spirochaetales bacterium]